MSTIPYPKILIEYQEYHFAEYKKKRGEGEKKRAERVAAANGGERKFFFRFNLCCLIFYTNVSLM